MLHLTTPLQPPGFKSSMCTYTSDILNGKEAMIQGFGDNNCNGTGDGTMRFGWMRGKTIICSMRVGN